jgi:hypothetical protein
MRRSGWRPFQIKSEFVDVTPEPIFAGFIGPNDGMRGSPKVIARVPPWRLITTPDMTALLTHAQMDPVETARSKAFFATRGQRIHGLDVVEVSAVTSHRNSNRRAF